MSLQRSPRLTDDAFTQNFGGSYFALIPSPTLAREAGWEQREQATPQHSTAVA